MIDKYDVGVAGSIQVSLSVYGKDAVEKYLFNDPLMDGSKFQMQSAVNTLTNPGDGADIAKVFAHARNVVLRENNGARRNATSVVIIFSDSPVTSDASKLQEEIEKLKAFGSKVIIVAIGDMFEAGLKSLATSPQHFIHIDLDADISKDDKPDKVVELTKPGNLNNSYHSF